MPLAFEEVPSPDGRPHNIVLLLHGLGDSAGPFARLARQWRLPQTLALALQAPAPIGFGMPGAAWFPAFEDDGERA
jgi:predicted esterase